MPLYEAVKLAAKQPPQPLSKTCRGSGPSTTCSGRPAAPPARPRPRQNGHDAGPGRALPARRGRRYEHSRTCDSGLPAGRGRRPTATVADRAAGHGRAPGRQPERRPSRSSSTARRAQFFVLKRQRRAARQGHHQPAAEHRLHRLRRTSSSASTATGQTAFSNVTAHDRPARQRRQHAGPDATTSTSRSRSTTS